MEEHLKEWFAYNSQANLNVIEKLLELKEIPEKAAGIFSHLLLAHKIWLTRIKFSEKNPAKPWEFVEPEDFAKVNSQNLHQTFMVLQNEDTAKKILYSNTNGQNFINSIDEILFHVLTHSSYHRGQVALLLRQEKLDPPLTDFIFYKR